MRIKTLIILLLYSVYTYAQHVGNLYPKPKEYKAFVVELHIGNIFGMDMSSINNEIATNLGTNFPINSANRYSQITLGAFENRHYFGFTSGTASTRNSNNSLNYSLLTTQIEYGYMLTKPENAFRVVPKVGLGFSIGSLRYEHPTGDTLYSFADFMASPSSSMLVVMGGHFTAGADFQYRFKKREGKNSLFFLGCSIRQYTQLGSGRFWLTPMAKETGGNPQGLHNWFTASLILGLEF